MKKRAKLTAAAVSLGALMTVGGTLAWFTDSETATNTVTTGYVDVEIREDLPTAEEQEEGNYTAEKNEDGEGIHYTNIMPGSTIEKNPSIVYTGSVDGYVRYRVYVKANGEEDETLKNKIVLTKENGKEVELDSLSNEDGWIYDITRYGKGEVVTGGTLFDKVNLDASLGNEIADAEIEIVIDADAIQADNITGDDSQITEEYLKTVFGEATSVTTGRVDEYENDKAVNGEEKTEKDASNAEDVVSE